MIIKERYVQYVLKNKLHLEEWHIGVKYFLMILLEHFILIANARYLFVSYVIKNIETKKCPCTKKNIVNNNEKKFKYKKIMI